MLQSLEHLSWVYTSAGICLLSYNRPWHVASISLIIYLKATYNCGSSRGSIVKSRNCLRLKHALVYVLFFRDQAIISGDRLDPGNALQHEGHSCSQRSERSALFSRYQSVPPPRAHRKPSPALALPLWNPTWASCPLPISPPPSHPAILYNFIFSSSIFIYRLVSVLIEFNLHHTQYFCFAPPPSKKRPRICPIRSICRNCRSFWRFRTSTLTQSSWLKKRSSSGRPHCMLPANTFSVHFEAASCS